jgi:uncharacterized repeat protein (TIGR01451 family)
MSKMHNIFQSALLGLISLGFPAASAGVEFASPVSYPVGTSPAGIVIADFNGDGKLDIAVANSGSANVSILLGNGDGTFKGAVNSPAGPSPQSLAVGDFNWDHKLDLIVVNPGDSTNNRPGVVNLLLGNGDGSFRVPVQIHASQFPVSVAVADFNNDQKLDAVIGDQSAETLSTVLGRGDGTFQSAQTIALGGSGAVISIVVADFNADNKPDVVASVSDATTANSGGRILLGNGDGSFQTATQVADSNHGGYLLVGDFDGDHRLDLALRSHIVSCGEGCISVDITNLYRGNGDGTFHSGNRVGLNGFGGHGGTIAAGDFNADSKLDFWGGSLFLGSGDGNFVRVPFDSSARGTFVAAADLNGDNLPDLALTDTANNALVVALNTSPTSGADLALDPRGGQFIDELVGSDVGFRAAIFNGGPQDATGVTWTETLPAGWKFVSAQPSQGTCSGTTVISCELGALAEPSSATIDFEVLLTTPGTFSDSQQVVGTQPDLNSKNNSASMTLTAVLPAPPDFTISPASMSLLVQRGGQASEVLTLGAQGGFAGTIGLACSVAGPAPMPTCGISPASVTPGNTATLTVNAAALSASLTAPWFEQGARLYAAWLPLELLGCVLVTGFDTKRRKFWALCLLMLAVTILPAACGSGSSVTKGPPPQNYTVTVSATSGAIQHSANVMVTVQ